MPLNDMSIPFFLEGMLIKIVSLSEIVIVLFQMTILQIGDQQVSTFLDCIGQCVELGAIFGTLLDVVAGAWVVGKLEHPGEAVETVANRDVDCLAKYPVSLFCGRIW